MSCTPARNSTKSTSKIISSNHFIEDLLKQHPGFFETVLKNKEQHNLQVIYTQIDRQNNNEPTFTDHYFNVEPQQYFYPASTVKLPVALLALQKLNELNIPGLDKNSTMITGIGYDGQTAVNNDPTTHDGRPTIAHYIKKIFLVSDNDAFNRLYEFLGQEYINNTLHRMGYNNAQIIHRLNISLPEDQNRSTNPLKFFDATGKLIYEKPLEKSDLQYLTRNQKKGKGYYRDGILINEPFDFSKKNQLHLIDLHQILRSLLFPSSVDNKQRFKLKDGDYSFIYKYMSMLPRESRFPAYNTVEHWDTYVKFILYGSEKRQVDPAIRIFNKVGDAYGYLIDAAYIVDFKNNIEFILTATIHCNSDGIFNDDKYDYETIGYPFLKNLGKVIYDYELRRARKQPDLSSFKLIY